MNIYDEIKKGQGEQSEIVKSVMGLNNDIEKGGEGSRGGKIKKSITLKEVVIQNAEIQKSHINNIFEYNDEFKVTKKGSEVVEV